MGEWYGKKIMRGTINPKTGNPWTLDDVPRLWKPRTITWLEEHGWTPEEDK